MDFRGFNRAFRLFYCLIERRKLIEKKNLETISDRLSKNLIKHEFLHQLSNFQVNRLIRSVFMVKKVKRVHFLV
jgi:hypothetical protein